MAFPQWRFPAAGSLEKIASLGDEGECGGVWESVGECGIQSCPASAHTVALYATPFPPVPDAASRECSLCVLSHPPRIQSSDESNFAARAVLVQN